MENRQILQLLMNLQRTLLTQQNLQRDIDNTPVQIKALEDDSAAHRQMVVDAENAVKNEKLTSSQLESELKGLQEDLSNKNLSALAVKTNEQLWAIQKEIKFIEDKISDCELGIITSMEELDNKTDQLAKAKEAHKAHEKANEAKIAELQKELKVHETEIVTVNAEVAEINDEIPGNFAQQLSRIQGAKPDGQAMAVASTAECSACFVQLRPQMMLEIKSGADIHQCPSCSRILYYLEPANNDEEEE